MAPQTTVEPLPRNPEQFRKTPETVPPISPPRRNAALDGLRAIAALAVFLSHAIFPHFSVGRAGVDVFFVLSGYLITGILTRGAHGSIPAFYLRRMRRLYPALIAGVILASLLQASPVGWRDAAVALLYLSDYGTAYFDVPSESLRHTWSLSVEEHFYLLWPWCVLGLLAVSRRARFPLLLGAYVLATAWRCVLFGWGENFPYYYAFDARLTGLILGSALAYLPSRFAAHGLYVSLAGGWAFALFAALGSDPLAMASVEIAAAGVILQAMDGGLTVLGRPALAYLGRISYGFYLFHVPIVLTLQHAGVPMLGVVVLGFIATGALAALSFHTIERWAQSRLATQRTISNTVSG